MILPLPFRNRFRQSPDEKNRQDRQGSFDSDFDPDFESDFDSDSDSDFESETESGGGQMV
jgi:hypothetical protein